VERPRLLPRRSVGARIRSLRRCLLFLRRRPTIGRAAERGSIIAKGSKRRVALRASAYVKQMERELLVTRIEAEQVHHSLTDGGDLLG